MADTVEEYLREMAAGLRVTRQELDESSHTFMLWENLHIRAAEASMDEAASQLEELARQLREGNEAV